MRNPKFYYMPDPVDGAGKTDDIIVLDPPAGEQKKEGEENNGGDDKKGFGAWDSALGEEAKTNDKIVEDAAKVEADKAEKIKNLGLAAEATDDEIASAEKSAKIKTLNLKEDATDDEIKAAEEKVKKEGDDDNGELTLDDANDTSKQDDSSSWVDTAKELGFEIKEDSFEAFKKANDERIEAIRQEERDKQYELKLDDHTPEAKALIKYLDNKGTLEEYTKPLAIFDEALSLSDEELVEVDLKLKKWDDDKIKEHIEVLKEGSTLEHTGYALRKQIEANKAVKANEILKSQELKFQQQEQTRLAEEKKENEAIKVAIDKTEEFLGGKLSKETKEKLFQKHLRGDYRKRLESSPEDAVKTMLFLEFGEKQYKQLKKDMFQEGKLKVTEKLHNIKKVEGAAQKTATATGFSAWDIAINGEGANKAE